MLTLDGTKVPLNEAGQSLQSRMLVGPTMVASDASVACEMQVK